MGEGGGAYTYATLKKKTCPHNAKETDTPHRKFSFHHDSTTQIVREKEERDAAKGGGEEIQECLCLLSISLCEGRERGKPRR